MAFLAFLYIMLAVAVFTMVGCGVDAASSVGSSMAAALVVVGVVLSLVVLL